MDEIENLIVGSGIAGLSVAYHLKENGHEFIIIDIKKPGGLCSTIRSRGFFFDITGHVIHCQTEYYTKFIKRIMGKNLLYLKRKAYFIFRQHLAPYPFQVYFYKIPEKNVVDECINGLIDVIKSESITPKNFKEWIIANFGMGISKYFMIPYNEKVWRFPLEQMSLHWVNKYVPKLDPKYLLKIVKAASTTEKEYGYNVYFFYPKEGGIQAVIDSIIMKMGEEFNKSFKMLRLNKVDPFKKEATLSNGMRIKWKRIITTIPLPEFVSILKRVPVSIKSYTRKLKCVSLLSLNLGIKGKLETDAHWIYFPERNVPFHRVVIQSNLSPYVAPDSTYSLIVEKSFKFGDKIHRKNIINRMITQLRKIGLIKSKDDILSVNVNYIKYAYPIYDFDWHESRSKVLSFLKQHDIYSIGRFGSWEYLSMEDAFMQGKDVTAKLISSF